MPAAVLRRAPLFVTDGRALFSLSDAQAGLRATAPGSTEAPLPTEGYDLDTLAGDLDTLAGDLDKLLTSSERTSIWAARTAYQGTGPGLHGGRRAA